MSKFTDATNDCRCQATITLRDKSQAQCGRRAESGKPFCLQHAKIYSAGTKALVADALRWAEQKRQEGWTKADFAAGLKAMLASDNGE